MSFSEKDQLQKYFHQYTEQLVVQTRGCVKQAAVAVCSWQNKTHIPEV